MLNYSGPCGAPPFGGWYAHLFFDAMKDYDDGDYIVADVHTQPTDAGGNVVGRVLHVGLGPKNLGIYVARSPSAGFQPMAYVGPTFTYYEHITDNFRRLTDSDWAGIVNGGAEPPRPDWTNSFLVDSPDWTNSFLVDTSGTALSGGRALAGVAYALAVGPGADRSRPAFPALAIGGVGDAVAVRYGVHEPGRVRLTVHDMSGRLVATLRSGVDRAGPHTALWHTSRLPAGMYVIRLRTATGEFTRTLFAGAR
jgi:hypothetical protein